MSSGGGRGRHRPAHARPSVLAAPRSLLGLGGLAVLVGVVIAAGAAVAGGPVGFAAHAAVPPSITESPADGASGTYGLAGLATSSGLATIGSESVVDAASPSASETQQPDLTPVSELAASGIPVTALQAYKAAADREADLLPKCGLSWPLLAGIGRVESDHGRFAGAVLHSDGLSTPPVIGIPLNGNGTALILDTDGGRLDGDTVYDRAVGPMQFIPSTWAGWGVDGNGDGVKDPFNIFDAADAAADYLCAGGRDLTTTHDQVQAILSYNYSWDYVRLVMSLERVYARDVGISVPVLPTSPEPSGRPTQKPKQPPVDPGKPRGATPPDSGSSGSASASPSHSKRSSSSSPSPSPTYSRSTGVLPSRTPSPTPTSTPTSSSSSSSSSPPPTDGSTSSSSTPDSQSASTSGDSSAASPSGS